MLEAKKVFALSATLGDAIGKRRLVEKLPECHIIDTGDLKKSEGRVKLDILKSKDGKRAFGKSILGQAL